ncbi:MAG: hypothetical protein AAF688_08050 [Bacteroidota bacterium]
MKQLDFMVGEWLGTSKTIKSDTVFSEIPAYEKIDYKLDGNIITIDLSSKSLQLHTVIYYSETDKTYYYNPYYKSGSARYPATFENGKFVVKASDSKRFIFTTDETGNFTEYGEQLMDRKWKVYFKDSFIRM